MTRQPTSALLKQKVTASYPVVSHGNGVYLYDESGTEYLDGCSGAMTASVGHGRAEIASALARQASTIAFSYRTQFTNQPAERLAQRLADVAPGDLDYTFFVNSGSEATEFAIRTAVGYWRERGQPSKVKVLGRHTSYHGMTMGALSLSGHEARRPDYGALLHPFPVGSPAYGPRYAHAGETETAYGVRAVAEFEAAIFQEGLDSVAAVIVEPIVGAAGGVLVPPTGYLAGLRAMCDRLGILLIADEVITGIGRTGSWFACTAEHVTPDILLFGKGLSGGYAPVAGALLRRHLVETIAEGSGVAPFGHTFSGNPLGAAACLAVLDIIEGEMLLENTQRRGAQFEARLREIALFRPQIANIRGLGLLWGFDLGTSAVNGSFVPEPGTAAPFVEMCFHTGLILYPGGIAPHDNSVIVSPPLSITQSEMTDLLNRLGAALQRWCTNRD